MVYFILQIDWVGVIVIWDLGLHYTDLAIFYKMICF